MLIIGLTGGLASGKSFIADQFVRFKIPVFDADLEVHKLLISDKEIFFKINEIFPKATSGGFVDKKILGKEVFDNKKQLQKLEEIIYPKLQKQENLFLKNCRKNRKKIAVLNIPLLFEKGGYKRCHKTIAVVASVRVQFYRYKNRFLLEEINNEDLIYDRFKKIIKNQTNNLRRKSQADYIIYNGLDKGFAVKQLKHLLFAKLLIKKLRNICV